MLRVDPAYQTLDAQQPALLDQQLGLEVQRQLAAFDGALQFAHQRQAQQAVAVQFGAVHGLAQMLRLAPVHRHLGMLQQRTGAFAVVGREGDAEGGIEQHADAAHGEGFAQQLVIVMGGGQRLLWGGRRHQQGKFVAAQPRQTVVLAQMLLQAFAQQAQQLVAGLVAEGVVEVLEVVQIHQQHGHPGAGRGGAQGVLQAGDKAVAVVQAGQRVAIGEEADGRLAFGNVLLHVVELVGQQADLRTASGTDPGLIVAGGDAPHAVDHLLQRPAHRAGQQPGAGHCQQQSQRADRCQLPAQRLVAGHGFGERAQQQQLQLAVSVAQRGAIDQLLLAQQVQQQLAAALMQVAAAQRRARRRREVAAGHLIVTRAAGQQRHIGARQLRQVGGCLVIDDEGHHQPAKQVGARGEDRRDMHVQHLAVEQHQLFAVMRVLFIDQGLPGQVLACQQMCAGAGQNAPVRAADQREAGLAA